MSAVERNNTVVGRVRLLRRAPRKFEPDVQPVEEARVVLSRKRRRKPPRSGVDPDSASTDTALIDSVREGCAIRLRFILGRGDDVNRPGINGVSPLMIACVLGHSECVWVMLHYGANANHQCENGRTPLHAACQSGSLACIQLLVEGGADVNRTDRNGMTALHFACVHRNEPSVNLLGCAPGIELNSATSGGHTPLHVACQVGSSACAEMLLKCGANVLGCGGPAGTPLYTACRVGSVRCVALLLAHHVCYGIEPPFADMLLPAVCESGFDACAVILLSQWPRRVNDRHPNSRWTPLHLASRNGHEECVRLLLAYGADPNALGPEDSWERPLHLANRHSHKACMQLLLSHGAGGMFHVPLDHRAPDVELASAVAVNQSIRPNDTPFPAISSVATRGMPPPALRALMWQCPSLKRIISTSTNESITRREDAANVRRHLDP